MSEEEQNELEEEALVDADLLEEDVHIESDSTKEVSTKKSSKSAKKSGQKSKQAVNPSAPDDIEREEHEAGGKVDKRAEKAAQLEAAVLESWVPKTSLGKKVKDKEIKDIDTILDNGYKILEPQIVDMLIPNLEKDLLLVGQAKGKFGGGKRRIFRQTQKKTPEGNKPKFATYAVVGNRDGYIGIGQGKAKETVPARDKSFRMAKLNIIKIRRGCGSWECSCKEPHSIPFAIEGKIGSVKIKLMPAPKGAGLVAEKECQRILEFAGVKDVYSKTLGQSQTKVNLVKACFEALKQLMDTRVQDQYFKELGIQEGKVKRTEESE